MLVHFGAFSGPHEALAELLDKPLRILKEDCWWEPRRIGGLRKSSNGWGCTPPTGTQQQWKIRRFMGVHTKKVILLVVTTATGYIPTNGHEKRLQQNEQSDLRFGFWRDWNFSIVANDLIHDAILEHSPEMCGFSARKPCHGRLPRVTHWCPPHKGLAAAASLETLGKCVPYHCTNSCCSWFDKGITWTCHGSFQEKELTWMRWFDFWDWSQAWFHRDIRGL